MQREVPRTGYPHPKSLFPGLASPIIWKPSIPGPSSIRKFKIRSLVLGIYSTKVKPFFHHKNIYWENQCYDSMTDHLMREQIKCDTLSLIEMIRNV